MTSSEAFQKEEDLESIAMLARAMRDLATAAKADTDARERAQKAALKQATAKIETKGKESGLTAETIKTVKALLEGG